MTTPLISVSYLKTFLPIRPGNTSFDEKLLSIIMAVTERFEQVCSRTFTKAERTEYHNSRNTRLTGYDFAGDTESGLLFSNKEQTLILRSTPIDTAQDFSVYYDPLRIWGTETLVDPDNYFVDADNGQVILNISMVPKAKSIKVVYTAGYTEADGSLVDAIPEDLKLACATQCIHVWTKTNPENVSVDEDTTDGSSGGFFSVKGGLLPDVAQALTRYKKVLTGNG